MPIPLLSVLALSVNRSFQSDLPKFSAIDLQTRCIRVTVCEVRHVNVAGKFMVTCTSTTQPAKLYVKGKANIAQLRTRGLQFCLVRFAPNCSTAGGSGRMVQSD